MHEIEISFDLVALFYANFFSYDFQFRNVQNDNEKQVSHITDTKWMQLQENLI